MAVVAGRCVEFNSRLALNLKALEHECYIEPGRMDEESGSTFVIPPDEIQYCGYRLLRTPCRHFGIKDCQLKLSAQYPTPTEPIKAADDGA